MTKPQHPRILPPTARRALSSREAAPIPEVAGELPVSEALWRMAELGVDAVTVTDGGRLSGIFSPRELVNLLVAGGSPATLLREAVREPPVAAAPDDLAEDCLRRLGPRSHLAVVDNGSLLGVLSRDDLLAELAAHGERVFTAIDLDQRIMFKRGTYSC